MNVNAEGTLNVNAEGTLNVNARMRTEIDLNECEHFLKANLDLRSV